ncbi:MAG TPA: hypothetical protein VK111_11590 [Virgibacillus sp.]|nr:hypothetical protein [Virgibacillus sp.]
MDIDLELFYTLLRCNFLLIEYSNKYRKYDGMIETLPLYIRKAIQFALNVLSQLLSSIKLEPILLKHSTGWMTIWQDFHLK